MKMLTLTMSLTALVCGVVSALEWGKAGFSVTSPLSFLTAICAVLFLVYTGYLISMVVQTVSSKTHKQ